MGCSASKPIMTKPPTFDEWNGSTSPTYSTYENESKSSIDSFSTCDKNCETKHEQSNKNKMSCTCGCIITKAENERGKYLSYLVQPR